LLDTSFTLSGFDLSLEGVPVVFESGVSTGSVGTALGWALWGRLGHASWGSFGWVWVLTDWSVVVAVWESEVRAVSSSEWARGFELSTGDGTLGLDVVPWGVDLSTLASIEGSAETDVLGRDWHLHFTLGGNAHTVRSSFGTGKGPTASTVGLVTDVTNDLGASGEGGGGVESVWNGHGFNSGEWGHFSLGDTVGNGSFP